MKTARRLGLSLPVSSLLLKKICSAIIVIFMASAVEAESPRSNARPDQAKNCAHLVSSTNAAGSDERKAMEPQGRTHDLSLVLKSEMLRFPGDPDFKIKSEDVEFCKGTCIRMSTIEMGLHLGTHIDAPAHFIQGGKKIADFSPDRFVGEVLAFDLSRIENSISRDDSTSQSLAAHTAFAEADIPVIVAVNMSLIDEGSFQFSAVPLLIEGAEASPVRVVVWKQ